MSHGQGRSDNGNYAVPRIVCEHFNFSFENYIFNLSHGPDRSINSNYAVPRTVCELLKFSQKMFSSIYRTDKADESTASTQSPEKFACIFIFLAKIFFFNI